MAILVEVGLYLALRRRSLSASWGDMRYGTMMSLVRGILLRIRHLPVSPRNWRPHILVFAGNPNYIIEQPLWPSWSRWPDLALRRRSLSASWGDMRYGTMMSLVRGILLRIRHLPVSPRNWRPHILVFAGDLDQRLDLVRFAAWLNQDRGLLSVCWLLEGEIEDLAPNLTSYAADMQRRLDDAGLTAFSEVHAIQNLESDALAVAQAHGIAGLVSNCVMFGWGGKPERIVSVLRVMHGASLLGKSTVICRIAPRSWAPTRRRIDVWWGGLESNGDMLLLFAHLLSMNPEWSTAEISVKCVSSERFNSEWSESRLADLLLRSRIDARPEVIDNSDDRPITDIIHESSRDADIVFLGLREPSRGG